MKEVCDLTREAENYAWCFDCVPEENSLLLGFGDVKVEIPSINLVFQHPHELLGEAVHARPRTPEENMGEAEQKALDAAIVDGAVVDLRLAGHERPARVLELWRDEVDDAEEQARVLGCTVAEVHRAREVVRRYMRKRKKSVS